MLIDHKGEGIDLDGDALVLRWPDMWSTDTARRALSPRRIPLTAVSHVEFLEKAVAIRVHLHGQDPAQRFSPATSVNAVSVPIRQTEAARAFANDVNRLLETVPDIVDRALTSPVTQQVEEVRWAGSGAEAERQLAKATDEGRRQWFATPAGQARAAKRLGHRWHEYIGTLESTYRGLGDKMLGSTASATGVRRRSRIDVISQIEREGWDLVFVDHVWRSTGSISGDELLSSGQQIGRTGDIVGVYMFRATDEAPLTDEPWNA